MKHRFLLPMIGAFALFLVLAVAGCSSDEEPTNPANNNTDIPADPGGTAPATTFNNVTPSATFGKTAGNDRRIRMNLLGILDPATGQPITFTANQNIFVSEDNVLKGMKVSAAGTGGSLLADVVFTVDNSGSMGQEADSVAVKIIAFVNFLQARGLDLRVGVVGYSGRVTGAVNLTTGQVLSAYLTRTGRTGTSRTVGYSGPDSARFQTIATTFASGIGGENGIVGIWFADSLFAWRGTAQRVYVNFTDEPTQPGNQVYWSTEGLCARWTPAKGTIHTVFSEDSTSYSWTRLSAERPWGLSACAGGTAKFIPSSAAGLDLTTLPVTGALANSSLVEFLSSDPNRSHTLIVTVKTATADGRTTFNNVTY